MRVTASRAWNPSAFTSLPDHGACLLIPGPVLGPTPIQMFGRSNGEAAHAHCDRCFGLLGCGRLRSIVCYLRLGVFVDWLRSIANRFWLTFADDPLCHESYPRIGQAPVASRKPKMVRLLRHTPCITSIKHPPDQFRGSRDQIDIVRRQQRDPDILPGPKDAILRRCSHCRNRRKGNSEKRDGRYQGTAPQTGAIRDRQSRLVKLPPCPKPEGKLPSACGFFAPFALCLRAGNWSVPPLLFQVLRD